MKSSHYAASLLCLLALSQGAIVEGGEPTHHGNVTIKRDEYGVPHIYASTTYDLFYGFGYALAEDHLFQMEMLTRTARGTVAEVLGEKYVEHDEGVRRIYDVNSLRRQYADLSADDRAIFEGYAAGYNARVHVVLASPGTLLPREYADFGFSPSEISALDILAGYEHSMALRFSDGNSEISNLALLNELESKYGKSKAWNLFEQLRWNSDPLAPTTIPVKTKSSSRPSKAVLSRPAYLATLSASTAQAHQAKELRQFGATGPDATPHASNVWLLGPSKTVGGITAIMNGPQMGNFSPGYIWGVGLHGAGYDMVGSGPLGSPWLIFGTNGKIAWGATAGLGDTVDIYQEKLDPTDAHRYFFNGRYRAMERRVESIPIRGSSARRIEIYSTVHGIVGEVDETNHVAYSRKRSWEGSEVRSLVAWMHSMQASDFATWRAAVADVTLSINNYYADSRGNIGYTFLGKFPRRVINQDRRLPASGTGDMEWQGFLPFESNPWVENPGEGYIANWNNKPSGDYPSSDSIYWGAVDHLNEIREQLDQPNRLSVSDIWDVNRRIAFRDDNARYFIPLIARAASGWGSDTSAGRGAALLLAWDQLTVDIARGTSTAPGYTLFQQFLQHLIRTVLADKVPPSVYGAAKPNPRDGEWAEPMISPSFPTMATKIVYNALLGKAAGVPQRVDLLGGREAEEVLRQAVGAAFDELQKSHGPDPRQWVSPSAEQIFHAVNYAGIPDAPETMTLRLQPAMNRGTENNRIVFDSLGVSACDVTPPGQSGYIAPDGNPSPHYQDQLAMYASFQCKSQWLHAHDVEKHSAGIEELKY